jgi:lysophospholipase L1-like esterase
MRKNMLLALAAALLTLLALETGVRAYGYFVRGTPFMVIGSNGADPTAAAIRGHPLFHYVPNPELPDVDEDFFRDTGSPPQQAGLRVAALGGSTTYDISVPAEGSYPFLLREALARRGMPARVLNGGAPGYQLAHVTSRYVHQVRHMLRPGDWLLIDVGFNDTYLHAGQASAERGFADFLKVIDDEDTIWRKIRIANWVRARLDMLLCANGFDAWFAGNLNTAAFRGQWLLCKPQSGLAPDRRAVARYADDLTFLIRMAQADGVRPVLLLQDYVPERTQKTLLPVLEPVRGELARAAAGAGAAVLDMRRVTASRPELFADGLHMNRRGNEMRAEALAELIRTLSRASAPSAGGAAQEPRRGPTAPGPRRP